MKTRNSPDSRRAVRAERCWRQRGDIHLGGLLGVEPSLDLDQLGPEALPVGRAQVPTTNGTFGNALNISASRDRDASRPPIHDYPDRNAERLGKLGQALESLGRYINCVVHAHILHIAWSLSSGDLNATCARVGTVLE